MKCSKIDLLIRIKGFFEDNIGWIELRADHDKDCFVLFNEIMHLLRLISEEEEKDDPLKNLKLTCEENKKNWQKIKKIFRGIENG